MNKTFGGNAPQPFRCQDDDVGMDLRCHGLMGTQIWDGMCSHTMDFQLAWILPTGSPDEKLALSQDEGIPKNMKFMSSLS